MWVLKYIKSTLDYGITYTKGNTLTRLCDLDWARDVDSRRLVTGYSLTWIWSYVMDQEEAVYSCSSSTKAEYKSACFASYEVVWLRRTLEDMGAA